MATESADAHYLKPGKKAYYHALGAQRFFRNHPRLARTPAGRVARRNHAWLLRVSLAHLHRQASPYYAICATFGRYCSQAWEVAKCEGGRPVPSVNARNGQYKGMFQMGKSERRRYGHGPDAWSQARAAFAYFAASGYDWSPWSCKP